MSLDFAPLARGLGGALLTEPEACRAAAAKQLATAPLPLPQAVARCASPADVQRALAFAAEHSLPVAVRSGGHCFGDFSHTEGLLLDLGLMQQIELGEGQVRLGPAALAGETALALAQRGRSLPTGGCPLVALGGLALVGGFGLQARRIGLLCDQVQALQLVQADGSLRDVDAASAPELFRALCGAGSVGFGVVTALQLRTHALPRLRVFHGQWPLAEAPSVIALWQALAPEAPSALSLELMLIAPDLPEEPAVVELFGCAQIADGFSEAQAADAEDHWRRALGPLAADLRCFTLEGMDAARYLCGLLDRAGEEAWMPSRPYAAPGFQCTRSDFHTGLLDSEAIRELVRHFGAERRYAEHRELEFVPWGGAIAHANVHSSFAHRQARLLLRHTAVVGARSTPDMRAQMQDWVEGSRRCVLGCASSGSYVGYAEPGRDRLDALYFGDAASGLRGLRDALDRRGVLRGGR